MHERDSVLAIASHCTVENHQRSHLNLWKVSPQVILTDSPDTQEAHPPIFAANTTSRNNVPLTPLRYIQIEAGQTIVSSFTLTNLSPRVTENGVRLLTTQKPILARQGW